ncbi:hypothetical protein BC941DRAFT_384371 [Chlamydoabsidia padenii]|nr:hypothetical protein BC941DRAFT_384371 [Chlamydoabsidia padenii]
MSNSAQDQINVDNSISTFTSALWFNAALGIGFFGAFLVLRKTRPQTYAPRTYATPLEKRPPPLSNGTIRWMWDIFQISDDELIRTMGLDRFMMLKFLRMGIIVFVSFSIVAIPILFPLNIINQLNSPGLNLLTIGNIRDPHRLWAHLILAVLLTTGLIYYTFHETRQYLVLRSNYLMSDDYRNSVMARTLYVPSIPKDVNTVENLKRIFSKFPGGVRHVWLNRDLKDLPDKVVQRQAHVYNLETTITKVILASYKHSSNNTTTNEEEGFVIPQKLRPTHRVKPGFLPFGLPLVGHKVDSIDYYNDEIARLNYEIHAKQRDIKTLPQRNSAFIEFYNRSAAHMAAQTLIHHTELQMAPRYIQIAPTDIIWENMNIKSFERLIRRMISLSVTTAIIIFWAFPVVFVQSISSLDSLSKILPFLSVVNNLGPTVVGIIQGILPAVALAILISLVPIIFAMLSKLEGIPQKSFVDLSVLHKYFFFQFVDVVLVSTIAGGILQTLPQLVENPTSIINILAENLPKASTFFITFVMLQATNSTGQAILQLVPYIMSFVTPIFSTTPRDIYKQKTQLPGISIGTLIPSHSVIFVLGIEYSTIAPLILPFVVLFFCLNYFVYLYQFLYVYEMEYETGGRAFPRAIRHVYIGMFTWQLTMIGLFAVRGNDALGQLVIMAITLVISAFSLGLYDKSFKPLFKYMPMDSFEKEEEGKLDIKVDFMKNTDKVEQDQTATTTAMDVAPLRQRHHSNAISPEKEQVNKQEENDGDDDSDDDLVDAEMLYQRILSTLISKVKQTKATEGDQKENPWVGTAVNQLYATEAYMHPATYDTQPPVWLPQDELGITAAERQDLTARGVYAIDNYATAFRNKQEKSKVEIDEQRLIIDQQGVPGSLPAPGTHLSSYQNYVRTFVDNFNFFAAMGGNGNFISTALGT